MNRASYYLIGGMLVAGLWMASQPARASSFSAGDKAQLDPHRYEPSFLPALGGNTDLGFIFGGFGVLAKFNPAYAPYRWRGEFIAVTSVKNGPQGAQFPMYAFVTRLDFPGVADGKLRILPLVSFTRTINAGYYGIGNASRAAVPAAGRTNMARYNQYMAGVLWGFAEFRYALRPHVMVIGGLGAHRTKIDAYKNSRLRADGDAPPNHYPPLRGIASHSGIKLAVGVHFDNRDHETATTRGMYHAVNLRWSPGSVVGTDLQFGGVTGQLRFYLPFLGGRLVAAMRVMGDVIMGEPPFYELKNMDAFAVIDFSGMSGVRGLPQGRFRGNVKILANWELRYMPLAFSIKNHRFKMGLAAFFDAGRVWAGLRRNPALDGHGLRPKIGAGGGPRIQWGETLMLRFDFAHSPHTTDAAGASPLAFYMDMKQIF